jgi:hypothetical protein
MIVWNNLLLLLNLKFLLKIDFTRLLSTKVREPDHWGHRWNEWHMKSCVSPVAFCSSPFEKSAMSLHFDNFAFNNSN